MMVDYDLCCGLNMLREVNSFGDTCSVEILTIAILVHFFVVGTTKMERDPKSYESRNRMCSKPTPASENALSWFIRLEYVESMGSN
ncbi:hypothetical protein S245_004811 [Arachis hypogaea]